MKLAVFVYAHYYPEGGWDDCYGVVETKEEAIDLIKRVWKTVSSCYAEDFPSQTDTSYQVIDLETQKPIDLGP